MVCVDPLDRSKWKGRLRDRTFKSPTLGKGKWAKKRIRLIDFTYLTKTCSVNFFLFHTNPYLLSQPEVKSTTRALEL